MQQEKKDKTISALTTLVIMVACAFLCAFIGYTLPNPPIEEEGMGVAGEVLGEIEGFGNNDNATFNDNSTSAPNRTSPNESYTTGEEPAPIAKSTKNQDQPTPTQTPEPSRPNSDNSNNTQDQTQQSTSNPNASFRGRRDKTGGEGKGAASGSGQAGTENGTQGAQGGTGSGNGASYSLGNRTLRGALPMPTYQSSKDGDVVVRIKVDRNGNVVEVDAPLKGSKNYDQTMVNAAKQAAMSAHFNSDNSATEFQYGTITYKFRRQG